jgi:NDP-sugar pyrophosphorylase family protein
MLSIIERPMLERVLANLALYGVKEAVLSLGYLPTAFVDAYPDATVDGVSVTYAVESEPLDTAGAISFAAHFAGIDDTFIVINGDVLTDLDVSKLLSFHADHKARATIALHPVDDPSSYGVVPTAPDGQVIAFVEKPPRAEAPTNMINAGTYVLEPTFLERVPFGRRLSIERETFPQLVKEGVLYAFGSNGYWLDTGTPADYLQAHHDILGRGDRADVTKDATMASDGSWREGTQKIEGTLAGKCFVGDAAHIGPGAQVTSSVVEHGVIVEPGAHVTTSVLLSGSRVAGGAKVDHSIVGKGATIGERCVLRATSVVGFDAIVPSGVELDGERFPVS